MEIVKLQEGNTVKIKLIGRLDANSAIDFEKIVKESIPGTENMFFDFEELAYISSAGFRVLLATRNNNVNTMNIKILHLQENVEELFEITGFSELFDIE